MPPSAVKSRSQSVATTALAGGTLELFRVKRLREIPQWWILGRCGPPSVYVSPRIAVCAARARADPERTSTPRGNVPASRRPLTPTKNPAHSYSRHILS